MLQCWTCGRTFAALYFCERCYLGLCAECWAQIPPDKTGWETARRLAAHHPHQAHPRPAVARAAPPRWMFG